MDEGVIKFDCVWRPGPAPPGAAVADLCQWRDRLVGLGYVGFDADQQVGYGNLSVRAAGAEVLISGTQTGSIASFGAAQITRVVGYDLEANHVTCEGPVEASSETLTHLALYELGSRVGAVIHIHATGLWNALRGVVPTTDPRVAYGTPAMAREIARLASAHPEARLLVMAGHPDGLIAYGADLEEAGAAVLAAAERAT